MSKLNKQIPLWAICSLGLYVSVFFHLTYWKKVAQAYPEPFNLFKVAIVLICVQSLVWLLLLNRYTRKVTGPLFLFLSSVTAYYVDTYGIIVSSEMIENVASTNFSEAADLLSWKLILYVIFGTVIPLFFLWVARKYSRRSPRGILKTSGFILGNILIVIMMILTSSRFFGSFFREHREFRFYMNPSYWSYSVIKYAKEKFKSSSAFKTIGEGSYVNHEFENPVRKELIIFVLGETARSDRFSLNGYQKMTNPFLEKEDVISFSNVSSCGTSTAVSVPCLFSHLTRRSYDRDQANHQSNLLDVLKDTGFVNILWRDNNSSSKGVALRVDYEDYQLSENNPVCDEECRDIGMLKRLDDYIKTKSDKDILIVLHQMGSHGPAYYKRYPEEFEKFKPSCKTNELKDCSREEINNAYDNTILYTDYFLSQVIQLLKKYNADYDTAMFYVSDHGESLGENNVYLHSLPYFLAPSEQKQVPLILWLGDHIKDGLNYNSLQKSQNKAYSHDFIFHTIINLFEVDSDLYDEELDILAPYQKK